MPPEEGTAQTWGEDMAMLCMCKRQPSQAAPWAGADELAAVRSAGWGWTLLCLNGDTIQVKGACRRPCSRPVIGCVDREQVGCLLGGRQLQSGAASYGILRHASGQ